MDMFDSKNGGPAGVAPLEEAPVTEQALAPEGEGAKATTCSPCTPAAAQGVGASNATDGACSGAGGVIRLCQTGRVLEGDVDTPISLFLGMVGAGQGILLESAEVDGRWGRYSVIGFNFLLRLGCAGGKLEVAVRDPRLNPLKELEGQDFVPGMREVMHRLEVVPDPDYTAMPPITRALYGYLGYGIAGLLEPKLAPVLPAADAEACLALPGTVVIFDHLYNRLTMLSLTDVPQIRMDRTVLDRAPQTPEVGVVRSVPDRAAYVGNVARVKEMIRQGEAIQVVLSTRFQAPFGGDPFTIYRRLRRINPSPYMFFMRLPGVALLGSSPEVMVRCEKSKLRVSPIAGTRPRGVDDVEDARLADELLADPKERAEHVMLVDLGRNDLGRVAKPGTVEVTRFMEVERFSHVMHLTSRVTADLKEGLDALDVLAATFPAGTVSGAPKVRAMEIIAGAEGQPRGPYAGAIGWFGLDRDSVNMDTGITIRSLWVRDGQAHWQAGAGIVFDSSPEAEWQECNNKAAAMRAAVLGTEFTPPQR